MVRWRRTFVDETRQHLARLGLKTCPVCESEQIFVSLLPYMISVGGSAWTRAHPPDPETNVLFMVAVECRTCGHTLLFNSERFRTGDEPIMFVGSEESEAQLDEAESE
jgi:hypothetical protein